MNSSPETCLQSRNVENIAQNVLRAETSAPNVHKVRIESLEALKVLIASGELDALRKSGSKVHVITSNDAVKEHLRSQHVKALKGDDTELRAEVARMQNEDPSKRKLVRLADPEEYAKMAVTNPEKLAEYKKTLADLKERIILRNKRGEFIVESDYPMLFEQKAKEVATPVVNTCIVTHGRKFMVRSQEQAMHLHQQLNIPGGLEILETRYWNALLKNLPGDAAKRKFLGFRRGQEPLVFSKI